MATANLKPTAETETERIERWRREALERAGYAARAAAELALRSDIDLHAAIGLVESGCPPETAAKILL
ncbi:MAG: hypothetical protein QOE29_2002 [Gaiellaceae bacterium]|jgi:hypothetical protein|nr:hypothetical protein [Gaiellaceae bacterium]MDX6514442.1 hypothetical protein [Gaiellaceae bacterium]